MESTRELRDQQKRRQGYPAIHGVGKRLPREAVVDSGGDPSKLVGLGHAQEFDRQTLAGMDAEIATLEGEAERQRQIQRLVELDAIVEEARAQVGLRPRGGQRRARFPPAAAHRKEVGTQPR